MGRYNHDTPQSPRDKQFIQWRKDNISVWPNGAKALANYTGNKFKNYMIRTHYNSLSYSWSVCTKQQWGQDNV